MSSEMVERVARALEQSFRDRVAERAEMAFEATGVTAPDAAVWERYARAAIEAMREPTREMEKAGFRANKFENKTNGTFGCPGVESSGEFPRPADFDSVTAEEAAAMDAWMKLPHCRIASITIPADKPWQAMIDAALT